MTNEQIKSLFSDYPDLKPLFEQSPALRMGVFSCEDREECLVKSLITAFAIIDGMKAAIPFITVKNVDGKITISQEDKQTVSELDGFAGARLKRGQLIRLDENSHWVPVEDRAGGEA